MVHLILLERIHMVSVERVRLWASRVFVTIFCNMLGTAYDLKSHDSDPEGQVDVDDNLEIPAELYNENEKNFVFVSILRKILNGFLDQTVYY